MPRSRTLTHQLELAALTTAFVTALVLLRLPAAFLLGAMAAAMVVVGRGGALRLPEPVAAHAGTFALSTFSVLLVATLVGLVLARARVLPGSTALWGMFPGGATVMVVLSGSFGGDMRLVAVMQYMRVVVAATAASLIARLAGLSGGAAQSQPWLGPVAWPSFAAVVAIVLFSGLVVPRCRVPAGALLVPMVLATMLQDVGLLRVELPRLLLVASYVVVGWAVGLRFTREAFASALHSLPQIIASVVGLVAACAGIAWALSRITHIDLLTAYLATSPGGADSIAIIAAGTPIDVAFVMSTQMARVVSVLVLGPPLVKQAAKLAPSAPPPRKGEDR
jgi:membrane AbrB-like protein